MRDDQAALGRSGADEVLLDRLVGRTRLTLAWEAAWPILVRAAAVPGLVVALAWLGVFAVLPVWVRLVVLAALAVVFVAAVLPLLRLSWPSRATALARLDRASAQAHRPATALDDRLAGAPADPVSQALWDWHRRQAAAAARSLRLGAPHPALAARDPHALRIALLLALVVGFFAAGPARRDRLAGLLDTPALTMAEVPVRVDAWVTPPAYTRRPPIMLTGRPDAAGAEGPIVVPENSVLVVRVAGDAAAQVLAEGAARVQDPGKPADAKAGPVASSMSDTVERRLVLEGDAAVTVRRRNSEPARYRFTVTPDRAPTIALQGEVRAAARGGMTLGYHVTDDYGVVAVEGRLAPAEAGGHPLYELPVVPLSPPANRLDGSAQATRDLSDHPLAGTAVTLTLVARDDPGHEGRSASVPTTLPARVFINPLARALVEQRRSLALDAGQAGAVGTALDGLMIAPEQFTKDAGVYLGLRTVRTRLASAHSDEALRDVVGYLWQMALQIEDGSMSGAERQLKAAREALRQAIERGASPDEIRRLTQELRQALNEFLQEYAKRQAQQQNGRQASPQAQQQTVTPKDLNDMLDRMEQAMRQGAKSEAEQLLSQLDEVLENLASPNQQAGGEQDPGAKEMEQALREMGDMIQRQQRLRDQTFQNNQQDGDGQQGQQGRKGRAGQGGQDQADQGAGQDGMGQNGRGQEGMGQDGQQGDGQPGSGRRPGERGGAGQGRDSQTPSLSELGQRQKALRNQLDAMRKRLQGQGESDSGGLGEAERAMRDAEGQLGQGDAGNAVASQGQALQALRNGARNLAQAMQGQPAGSQSGRAQRMGRGTGNGEDRDPAGRPMRSRGYADGTVKVPGRGETDAQRAARVLDELRRRYAEPLRPPNELDYIGRLLRPEQDAPLAP